MIKYGGESLAFVIPTRNRPHKVSLFLESAKAQSVICKRIIIVASGDDIREAIQPYCTELPVEYYYTDLRGQIAQRNLGISKLDSSTPLVASFDDDIELEPNATEIMLSFWNQNLDNTAGVAFNIINSSPHRRNRFLEFIQLSKKDPGQVIKTGRATPLTAVKDDIKTEWLCGGATVWRLDVLNAYKVNQEIKTCWAPCEDIMFSYPVGKKFDLYVCAKAKVRHEHVFDHTKKSKNFFYSRVSTMWRIFFISSHRELSLVYYMVESFVYIFGRLLLGTLTLSLKHFEFAFGRIVGILSSAPSFLGRISWQVTLSD